eukprot:PhF_6_TR2007/c0_g1_i1/m.3426
MANLRYSFVFTLIVLLSLEVVHAAYKPGWIPRDCLSTKYRPSNVSVDRQGFHVDVPGGISKVMTLQGVGYSPIPPSKWTFVEPFDYFTSGYSAIWKRDLPLMAAMGINTIRVWSWDFFRDHTDFLDNCLKNNIFVMIPFMFRVQDYPDLADGDTRQQLFIDWRAFVQSQKQHPAVLAFLIGNELDQWYATQKDELFSAINVMIQIRDEYDEARHPVSVPLSDSSFILDYVKPYYAWTNVDFWSLQIYRDKKIEDTAKEFYQVFINHQNSGFRPLVLTEFGVDALELPPAAGFWPRNGTNPPDLKEDQYKQANILCQMYAGARSTKAVASGVTVKDVIAGTIVMEWNDEWWKGTFPDVRNPLCPNMRSDMHTFCSDNVNPADPQNPNFVHEEWLGLSSQIMDPARRHYCIVLRHSYYAIQAAYTTGSCSSWTIPTNETICADIQSFWIEPWLAMLMPVIIVLLVNIAIGVRLRRLDGYPLIGEKPTITAEEFAKSCEESKEVINEEQLDGTNGKLLRQEVGEAFLFYCNIGTTTSHYECPYFVVAQERIIHMVWDKYLSYNEATESAMLTATRVVYEQYMEGYYLWRGFLPPTMTMKNMMQDLALLTIIQTWAGTIQHAPEKIYEIFDFAKNYFEKGVSSVQSSQRVSDIQDFHHGLVEIFRVYYLKVDAEQFTFDDVNSDSIYYRKQLRLNEKRAANHAENYKRDAFGNVYYSTTGETGAEDGYTSDGGSSCVTPRSDSGRSPREAFVPASRKFGSSETELLPFPKLLESSKNPTTMNQHPYLEYHAQRSPEEVVLSTCASFFFKQREPIVGSKWFNPKFAFKQRGGPLTLLLNYSWVIRMILWQGVFAWYFQPAYVSQPLCLCEAFMYLAILDSVWNFFVFLFHYRVLGRLKRRTWAEGIWAVLSVSMVVLTVVPKYTMKNSSLYTKVIGVYMDGTSNLHKFEVATVHLDVFSAYLAACVVNTVFDEIRLFLRTDTAYPIRGRFLNTNVVFRMRLAFFLTLLVFGGLMGIIYMKISILEHALQNTVWPNFPMTLWTVVAIGGSLGLTWGATRLVGRLTPAPVGRTKLDSVIRQESNFLVTNLLFWGCFFAMNFMLSFYVLIPSVENIQFSICKCDARATPLTTTESDMCTTSVSVMCYLAVAFSWISAYLVSFVCLYAVFEIQKLVFGIARAKYIGVGNIQNWSDVEQHFDTIKRKGMVKISLSLANPLKQDTVWNNFIDHLHEDCLINNREKEDFKINREKGKNRPNFVLKPRSAEAERRIIHFLWTLESMLRHDEVGSHSEYRMKHRVRTMPTWTVTVPIYNEPIYLTEEQLKRNRTEKKQTVRISELEYLVHTLPHEWDNFAEKIKNKDKSWVLAEDNYPMDLLNSFLEHPGHRPLSEEILLEIRIWATMRGQTLARTIGGLVNCHRALVQLAMLEDNITLEEAERLASRKYQVVIAHQTYDASKNLEKDDCEHEHCVEMAFRQFKHFDLVYNNDKQFQSCLKRLRKDVKCLPQEPLKYTRRINIMRGKEEISRKVYNYFPPEAYETRSIQRVGRLKIGEGKAENQMHAVPFATGVVFQAIDMNQYATIENGLKIPYCLSDYFNNPHDVHTAPWDHHSIIPPYRILGFPEHTYTRCLSTVGEMMGAAEWCFVTISQRTLVWPLRIRAHYGHPDFFDGFWVRNRGGGSKASLVVNTNEDIFAGYEMIGRGEKGSYVEFIEYQKGRETAFLNAFVFEGKLAQGGAQQVRSLDVYRLNRKLDIFSRFSLFFSSLAFYCTNLVMAITVNYYILAIALFALSGVSYHKLGLLDAVVAVPWIFQIGYVMAIPMICELIIQKGFLTGITSFLRTLPPSVFFFIFHMRTKTYYFTQGLLVGKGGYKATGRGFGLDRSSQVDMYQTYSESHFHEATMILMCLFVYGIYGGETWSAFLLRTFTICLIVISWFWAPIMFNPSWTPQELQNDVREMLDWIGSKFHRMKRPEAEKLLQSLDASQHKRLLTLINGLESECRQTRGAGGESGDNESADNSTSSTGLKKKDSVLKRGRSTSFGSLVEAQKAVKDVHDALVAAQSNVEKSVKSFEEKGFKDDKVTADALQKKYWGTSEADSWMAWWLKSVLIMQWESEDEFFPGLINLTMQKTYLICEMFFPWIVVCVNAFHPDSQYFGYLVAGAYSLFAIVDHWLKPFHEHSQMMKASILLTAPFAVGFFETGYMSFSQLTWSMIMYYLCLSLLTRAIYGVKNIILKYNTLGVAGNPYHVDFTPVMSDHSRVEGLTYQQQLTVGIENRIHEMEALNDCEKQRVILFLARIQFPQWLAGFRRIQPLICMPIVSFGGILAVSVSGWLTTMMYNGRVSECWRKCQTRMVIPEGKKPPQPPPEEPPRNTAADSSHAHVGSIAASLPNAERPKSSRVTRRLHISQQNKEKAERDRSMSDSEGHGSLPTFSRMVNMEPGTQQLAQPLIGRSPATLIDPGTMEEQPRSFSKSPISFTDLFSRNQGKSNESIPLTNKK